MQTFAGLDRRVGARRPRSRAPVAIGLAALAGAWVLAALLALVWPSAEASTAHVARAVLEAMAGTIAVATGVVGILDGRFGGKVRLLWTGSAFAVLGALAVPALISPGGTDTDLLSIRVIAHLTALTLFGVAAVRHPVDTRVEFRVVGMWAASIFLSSLLVVGFVTALRELLVETPSLLAACWFVAASALAFADRRDEDQIDPWRTAALAGIGSAQLADAFARVDVVAWEVGGACLLLVSVALGGIGAMRAFLDAYLDERRGHALATQAAAAEDRQRRHGAANALTALGGAALTLERHYDRLAAEDRAHLTQALGAEVSRLQDLLARTQNARDAFALEAVLPDGLEGLDVARAQGLWATGAASSTTEALRDVLAFAKARGGPVRVRGGREANWVLLRVMDSGSPLTRDERRRLADDDDSPLANAARAMRRQGGDLWVDVQRGRMAVAVCLPAAPPEARAEEK